MAEVIYGSSLDNNRAGCLLRILRLRRESREVNLPTSCPRVLAMTARTSTTKVRWATAVGVLFLLVLSMVGYGPAKSWLAHLPIAWPSESFSPAAWQATGHASHYRLYRDLDAKGVLRDKRREEVRRLLGEPDHAAPDGSYLDYTLRRWSPSDRMLYAVVWLHVRFSTQGVVESYRIRKE